MDAYNMLTFASDVNDVNAYTRIHELYTTFSGWSIWFVLLLLFFFSSLPTNTKMCNSFLCGSWRERQSEIYECTTFNTPLKWNALCIRNSHTYRNIAILMHQKYELCRLEMRWGTNDSVFSPKNYYYPTFSSSAHLPILLLFIFKLLKARNKRQEKNL